jgi:hypothetical protein
MKGTKSNAEFLLQVQKTTVSSCPDGNLQAPQRVLGSGTLISRQARFRFTPGGLTPRATRRPTKAGVVT